MYLDASISALGRNFGVCCSFTGHQKQKCDNCKFIGQNLLLSTADFIPRFAAPRALAIMPGHVKAMQTRSASTTAPGTTISWCTGKSSHPIRSATSKGEMLFFNSPTVNVPLAGPCAPSLLFLSGYKVMQLMRPPLSWLNFPCSPRFLSVSCTFFSRQG